MNEVHSVVMKAPTSKLPKPRVKNKEIRTQEIQKAACAIFFKKGYQNSTIAEIAKKAGISEGMVYLYFKNKGDLYISLMIPVVKKLGMKLDELEETLLLNKIKTASELVDATLKLHLETYHDDPDSFRIISAFQQGNLFAKMSKETRKQLDNLGRSNFQKSRRIIFKAKEIGIYKKEINEVLLADIYWALFIGAIQVEETKYRATQKDHLLQTLNYAFSLICHGIEQKKTF